MNTTADAQLRDEQGVPIFCAPSRMASLKTAALLEGTLDGF